MLTQINKVMLWTGFVTEPEGERMKERGTCLLHRVLKFFKE